jgi:hypothetical protein
LPEGWTFRNPGKLKSACKIIEGDEDNLIVAEDCAGQWTHCVAEIRAHPYQMNVENARSSQHGWELANQCRSDVIVAHYYSSPIVICAPYIRCCAPYSCLT